jgi:hypothetical protein
VNFKVLITEKELLTDPLQYEEHSLDATDLQEFCYTFSMKSFYFSCQPSRRLLQPKNPCLIEHINLTAMKMRIVHSFFHTVNYSVTMKEKINREFTRIGPKRDAVRGDCRRLHNGDLRRLHSSTNITRMIKPRRMRWAGLVARMGERKGPNRALVKTLEGKRQLRKPRQIWVYNIRMDIQEIM